MFTLIALSLLTVSPADTLLDQVNTLRTNQLRHEPTLQAAAQAYANHLANTNSFSHTANGDIETRIYAYGFKGTIRQPAKRLANGEISYGLGEVLGLGQPNSYEVVRCWMLSEGHKSALLEPTFDSAGFAYAVNRNGVPLWVGVLGCSKK